MRSRRPVTPVQDGLEPTEHSAGAAAFADAAASTAPLADLRADPRPAVGASVAQRAWFLQLLCYVVWYALLWAGVAAYEGEPIRVKSKDLPLHWFDLLFRRTGAALAFGVCAARAAATLRLAPARGPDSLRRVDLLWPVGIYALQTLVRGVVYWLHAAGYIFSPRRYARDNQTHPPHVMSDHILLGASVHAALACEAVMVLPAWEAAAAAGKLGGWPAGRRGAALFLRAYSALATALALLVAAECYFTARYFHPPGEILLASAIGAALFQAPLVGYARWALGRSAVGPAGAAARQAAGGKAGEE
ncbi:hypothetical protein ABPG75_002505 [Micractinium tetrahymenae]